MMLVAKHQPWGGWVFVMAWLGLMAWNITKAWPPAEATKIALVRFSVPLVLGIVRAFVSGGHANLQGAIAVLVDAALIGTCWWAIQPILKSDANFDDRRTFASSSFLPLGMSCFLLVFDVWRALAGA
jgi:hypothetical protein